MKKPRLLTDEELTRVVGGNAPDKAPEEEPPPQDQENTTAATG